MLQPQLNFLSKAIVSLHLSPWNLDSIFNANGSLTGLYALIARENDFDLYSYEYEMMRAENIILSQAEGLIAEYIVDGKLDALAFESAWRGENVRIQLQDIAQNYMTITDLQQHPEIEQALKEAYLLGQSTINS